MSLSSHRIRAEERRIKRRLLVSLGGFILFVCLLFFLGLPLFTRLLSLSSKPDTVTDKRTESDLFAPIFDPLPEATNTSRIRVSGFAQKQAAIQIFVNGSRKIEVQTEADGRFESNDVPLDEGENIISAVVLRDAKESTVSARFTVVFQKNPPALEITSPQQEESNTNAKEVTIRGTTDAKNVMVNDRRAIIDGRGNFSYYVRLSDGENTFTIVARDQTGNETKKERKITYSP